MNRRDLFRTLAGVAVICIGRRRDDTAYAQHLIDTTGRLENHELWIRSPLIGRDGLVVQGNTFHGNGGVILDLTKCDGWWVVNNTFIRGGIRWFGGISL